MSPFKINKKTKFVRFWPFYGTNIPFRSSRLKIILLYKLEVEKITLPKKLRIQIPNIKIYNRGRIGIKEPSPIQCPTLVWRVAPTEIPSARAALSYFWAFSTFHSLNAWPCPFCCHYWPGIGGRDLWHCLFTVYLYLLLTLLFMHCLLNLLFTYC